MTTHGAGNICPKDEKVSGSIVPQDVIPVCPTNCWCSDPIGFRDDNEINQSSRPHTVAAGLIITKNQLIEYLIHPPNHPSDNLHFEDGYWSASEELLPTFQLCVSHPSRVSISLMVKDTTIGVESSAFISGWISENLMLYLAFGSAERLERKLIGLEP